MLTHCRLEDWGYRGHLNEKYCKKCEELAKSGNNCHFLSFKYPNGQICVATAGSPKVPYHVLSFPVKHVWDQQADSKLIDQSARQLMAIIEKNGFKKVVLPRPGCGNGRLKWEYVKRSISKILDDRVHVITQVDEAAERR